MDAGSGFYITLAFERNKKYGQFDGGEFYKTASNIFQKDFVNVW